MSLAPTQTPSAVAPPAAQLGGRPGAVKAPKQAAGQRQLGYLDLLRLGAIVAVVCVHAVGTVTRKAGTGWHPADWWGANFLNSACLWCVPVFIMVSGALLLSPAKPMSSSTFLRKRTVRLGVPLIFWTLAYLVFQRQFYGASLGISDTWKAFASGDPYLQLYFLFIVGGLTVLTPVLRRLVAHCSRRELYWLTVGALGFGLLEHAIRDLGGGGGFNAVTIFLPYVGYFLAGYVLATAQLPVKAFRHARWLVVAAWLATALGSAALAARIDWSGNGSFLYDYLSPTVMVMSLAIFVAFRGVTISSPRTTARLRRLGGATYGVFLIHPLLLFPVMRALGLPDGQDLGRTVAWALPLALGVCVVAEGLCLVLERVPVVRRLIS